MLFDKKLADELVELRNATSHYEARLKAAQYVNELSGGKHQKMCDELNRLFKLCPYGSLIHKFSDLELIVSLNKELHGAIKSTFEDGEYIAEVVLIGLVARRVMDMDLNVREFFHLRLVDEKDYVVHVKKFDYSRLLLNALIESTDEQVLKLFKSYCPATYEALVCGSMAQSPQDVLCVLSAIGSRFFSGTKNPKSVDSFTICSSGIGGAVESTLKLIVDSLFESDPHLWVTATDEHSVDFDFENCQRSNQFCKKMENEAQFMRQFCCLYAEIK